MTEKNICSNGDKMNLTNYEMLVEILQEFQREYYALQQQIDENHVKIQEADCYIQSILNRDDVDFKIFPREVLKIFTKKKFQKLILIKKNIKRN